MTNWLVKTFIRDAGNGEDPAVRQRYGLLSGIVGILLNLDVYKRQVPRPTSRTSRP